MRHTLGGNQPTSIDVMHGPWHQLSRGQGCYRFEEHGPIVSESAAPIEAPAVTRDSVEPTEGWTAV
jgi:hypothetical protein